jgi:recombination protein RecT
MTENSLALIKKDVVDVVQGKVQEFISNKELILPENYSAENAMKSAWLMLQSIKDKNGKAVLVSCSKDTVANALLDMVVQGLNPAKKQCYFIAYGGKLELSVSYFGTIVSAKNVDRRIGQLTYQAIKEGDTIEVGLDEKGVRHILKHEQPFENLDNAVIGSYCNIYNKEGELMHCEIMTIKMLKQVWQQGKFTDKMNPIDTKGNIKESMVHGKFTDQMAIKSVVNRGLKYFINTSDDSGIIADAYNRTLGNEFEDKDFAKVETVEKEKRTISLDDAPKETTKKKDKPKINIVDADFEEVPETKKETTAKPQTKKPAETKPEQQGFDDNLEGSPFEETEDIPY